MARNGSCTSCFIILSHMHGKYLRLTQHTPSFPDSTQAEYAHIRIHVHNASFMIVFRRFHRYRISVYRKQAGNSETMTSYPRGRHGTATIRSDTWRHRFHMPSSQRRIEQDEHDPWQFCSSTYVDIADNNRKYPFTSISHAIIDRKLNPRLPQAYMTSDRNDGFIPT